MEHNQSFTVAHIILLLISAILTVWYAFASVETDLRLDTPIAIFNALLDSIVSYLIMYIVHESSKVRLTNNLLGEVRFRRADYDSENSSEEEVEPDRELEEWLNDEMARRYSFERKMDARTARASLGVEWLVAGQMTQQFLAELEMHCVEAEGGIEDSDTVDYNSFTNLKNYASVNYDED